MDLKSIQNWFPTRTLNVFASILVMAISGPACGQPNNSEPVAKQPPNIVLIMIDDLGWPDVGCYGSSFVDTPHIDRLASAGVRFTNFYAAGAVCSPTRCAVQTGQNQVRIGITDFIPGHWRPFERVITPPVRSGLPAGVVTIADSLKQAGYATGYIGKWHLNEAAGFHPGDRGYDFAAVINGPHYEGRYRVVGRPDLKPKPGQYRTEFESDLAKQFIRQKTGQGKPFFLMVSPFAVHIPLGAKSDKVAKYRARAEEQDRELPHPVYAAMIEHCDDLVGQIVDAIEDAGVSDQTMVVFTSDNGGLYRRYDYRAQADDNVASMQPLRGEKGTLYEGGIRVPLIVKYPGKAKAGMTCQEPTISYDFFPTFVAVAEGQLPANQVIDGRSLLPLLSGQAPQLSREALHWHYPHYHHGRPASCIRKRDWKLIEYLDGSGDVELFQLSEDISETNNLAIERPAMAEALRRELGQWRRSALAAMPIPNPAFDPNRAAQWYSRRTGKPVDSDARKRFPPTTSSLHFDRCNTRGTIITGTINKR